MWAEGSCVSEVTFSFICSRMMGCFDALEKQYVSLPMNILHFESFLGLFYQYCH